MGEYLVTITVRTIHSSRARVSTWGEICLAPGLRDVGVQKMRVERPYQVMASLYSSSLDYVVCLLQG